MSGLALLRRAAPYCGLVAVAAMLCRPLPALAAGGGKGAQGERDAYTMSASLGQKGVALAPPKHAGTPIDGVGINVAQFLTPGVPDRNACRTLVRVENRSGHKVAFYILLRVYSAEGNQMATWMAPSGNLADGEASERMYSCQIARYLKVDQGVTDAWPVTCTIDGNDLNPCPLRLSLDSNIDGLPADVVPKAPGGGGEEGAKSGH